MKIKLQDFLKALKFIVKQRRTAYSNQPPYNCGFIWASGVVSFDCIGLVKAMINSHCEVAYKTTPTGSYIRPGQVIPDTTEYGILSLCTSVKWGSFKDIQPGEYLYMSGHAGIYVGDLFGKESKVNVVECTSAWRGGVVASWIDLNTGIRKDWQPGTALGRWAAHGKLTPYIDYKEEKKKSMKMIAKEVISGKWGNYPERKAKLEAAGYNYEKVQKLVNELLKK